MNFFVMIIFIVTFFQVLILFNKEKKIKTRIIGMKDLST